MKCPQKNIILCIVSLLISIFCLVFVCFSFMRLPGTGANNQAGTPAASSPSALPQITSHLRNGLQLASESPEGDNDTAQYADMLIENALRQFANYPEAAADVWNTLTAGIQKAEPQVQRKWVDRYLQFLDEALLNCTDQAVMRHAWNVRRVAIDMQGKLPPLISTVPDTDMPLEKLPEKETPAPVIASATEGVSVEIAQNALATSKATLEAVESIQKALQVPENAPQTSPDAAQIAGMLREGLKLASAAENNDDDAISYASALIENAMEHFANCPEAAPEMWNAQSEHIQKAEPVLQFAQAGLFLEYLDRSLQKCTDVPMMQKIWLVRKEAVQMQEKAQENLVAGAKITLNDLTARAAQLEADLMTQKKGDAGSEAFYDPAKKMDKDGKETDEWNTGPYQGILEKLVEVQQDMESSGISDWLDFEEMKQAGGENVTTFPEKLGELFAETLRLQRLRYNLWANRRISQARSGDPKEGMRNLAKIDTGLLIPTVYTLYSEVEQQSSAAITDLGQRTNVIRTSLLSEKIPLKAF